MARFVLLSSLFTIIAIAVSAQTPGTSPIQATSDPQAISIATKSVLAMTGGASISDATLSATVTWIAGSDNETGSGTFTAKGVGESRVDLNLPNGVRSEVRNNLNGSPQGTSENGESAHPWSLHNCLIDPVWFFPALSSLTQGSNSNIVVSYVGSETWNGISVQHFRIYSVPIAASSHAALLQHLSSMDFYLDTTSQLPVRTTFMVHPDNDATTDIRSEVRFTDYRSVNGILMPYHIQKLLNGSLLMDIQVTSAVINSGLSDSQFNIQ